MPKIKTDKKYNLRSKKINPDTIKPKEEPKVEPVDEPKDESETEEIQELKPIKHLPETKKLKKHNKKDLDETVIVTLDATKTPLLNSLFQSLSSLKPKSKPKKKPAKVVHKLKSKKKPVVESEDSDYNNDTDDSQSDIEYNETEDENSENEQSETEENSENDKETANNSEVDDDKNEDSEYEQSESEEEEESEEEYDDDDDSTYTESSEIEYNDDEQEYLDNLPKKRREQLINQEKEIRKEVKPEVPTRFKILMSDLSDRAKFNIIQRIDHFNNMSPMENEYSKLNQWKNTLDKVPFGKYLAPPISRSDPPSKILNFLHDMRTTLNKAVYGHEEAKTQIIQLMAQQISNPGSIGNCMAIQGPMGNGKTTLVKEGICKALGRPFVFIPLGGLTSAEFLIGHDYTFEGSRPGRIVEMLTECGCMNPVVYFDELDKVSETSKGEEIHNLLIHLTDISQNKEFHDKYFSGIDFDLSKVIFIFSYNDATRINPILLDRMIKIKTEGFKPKDKIRIAKEYLLPRLLETYGFQHEDIVINDETMMEILNKYEEKEEGVRNLRRCLENIVAKVNVYRLIHSVPINEVNITLEIVDKDMEEKVKLPEILVEPKKDKQILPIKKSAEREVIDLDLENFSLPFTITNEMLSKLIHKNKEDTSFYGMYS